jgi:DNA-binding transcriptional MerR regulator
MTPHDPSPAKPLTTTALCRRAQVTRGQLRVYEREGLIEPPRRTPAGYRDYPPDTSARLQAIRHLKELGFTLAEIALLLSEGDAGRLDPVRLQQMAQAQLQAIDARLQRLQFVRGYVAAVAAGDLSVLEDPECGFLMQFLASGSGA